MFKTIFLPIVLCFLLTSCASFKGPHEFEQFKNIKYSKHSFERHKGDLYIPKGVEPPFPIVLLVHGGGWKSRSKNDMKKIAESLAGHGFAVFNINYRLAPKYKHPAPVEDLHAALLFLKEKQQEYKIDLDQIGLWGYSSGGHTVSYYASAWQKKSSIKVQAVVAGGAPFNFLWYPKSPYLKDYVGDYLAPLFDKYEQASVTAHVQERMPSFFLYHARKDKLVEAVQSTAFAAELKKNGHQVNLHLIDTWGHSSAFIFSSEAVKKAILFLKEELKRPSS